MYKKEEKKTYKDTKTINIMYYLIFVNPKSYHEIGTLS